MGKIFARYNGIIDKNTEGIHPYHLDLMLGFCSDIQERLNSKRTTIPEAPQVCVCIILHDGVNGTIEKHGDVYYIGIFIGTFFVFENLFMRMLASPKLFINHGDVRKEVEHDAVFEVRTDHYEHVRDLMGEIVYPNDEHRARLANELKTLVLNFLVYHEYGHIYLGHLDYGLSKDLSFCLHENYIFNERGQRYDPVFHQVCEIEADRYASYQTILAMEVLINNNIPYFTAFYPDIHQGLYLYTFSVYAFFKIIEGKKGDSFNKDVDTHPSKSIRRNLMLDMISRYFGTKYEDSDTFKDDIDEIAKIYHNAINDVEKSFSVISAQQFDGDFKIVNEDIENYKTLMIPKMKEIRLHLDSFTFPLNQ